MSTESTDCSNIRPWISIGEAAESALSRMTASPFHAALTEARKDNRPPEEVAEVDRLLLKITARFGELAAKHWGPINRAREIESEIRKEGKRRDYGEPGDVRKRIEAALDLYPSMTSMEIAGIADADPTYIRKIRAKRQAKGETA